MITMIIILLAVTTAFRMLNLAFLQKNLTQDRVIAINLAREGVEAVRYMRDYNWLYYGSKRRVCWNHLQDNNSGDGDGVINGSDSECTESGNNGFATNQIGSHIGDTDSMEYALKQDGSHWFLTRKGFDTHIENGDWDTLTADKIATNEGTIGGDGAKSSNTTDTIESFRLCKDNAGTDIIVSCLNGSGYSAANANDITKFFRYVKIEYPNHASYSNDPTSTTSIEYPTGSGNNYSRGQLHNKINVIVGVKWEEAGNMQDVELVTLLSDFYERGELDIQN
jgi:hypothetical protein